MRDTIQNQLTTENVHFARKNKNSRECNVGIFRDVLSICISPD